MIYTYAKSAFSSRARTPLLFENSTPAGFEPIGLAGRRLNHSAKVSLFQVIQTLPECVALFHHTTNHM